MAFAINEELRKVPLDIRLVAELLVVHLGELFEHGVFDALSEALERLFRRKIGEQRIGGLAVDVDLFKLRELRAEFQCAERMDLVLAAGRLIGKLVAGEIEDLKALVPKLPIHCFERIVVRRKPAAGRRVDDQKHLALVFGKTDVVTFSVLYREIIDRFHCSAPFLF